jgi:hypothetical protein
MIITYAIQGDASMKKYSYCNKMLQFLVLMSAMPLFGASRVCSTLLKPAMRRSSLISISLQPSRAFSCAFGHRLKDDIKNHMTQQFQHALMQDFRDDTINHTMMGERCLKDCRCASATLLRKSPGILYAAVCNGDPHLIVAIRNQQFLLVERLLTSSINTDMSGKNGEKPFELAQAIYNKLISEHNQLAEDADYKESFEKIKIARKIWQAIQRHHQLTHPE